MQEDKIPKEGLDTASDVLTETVEQEPNPESQKEAYEKYLQLDEDEAQNLTEVDQTPSVSDDFDSLSDDELETLYEQYLKTDEANRTDEQTALLEQTKERFLKIKFYREFEDAALWFETEYPESDFREVVNNNDFLEFAQGIKLPVRELIRRYMKMEQKYGQKQKYVGSGSVSSNGATVGKDYFSLAEVNRMSKEEVAKNLETIKKSMRKWK